ncbi:hypothetical protein BCT61_14335 [Vibrio breoganii]|uniref:hypothetical protein n=1 Tax=Vibrio breoganii TaxID=553239 RepID=UPI000C85CDD2|nr:hypothetical protein [Vibrio breoganii]PMM06965.1 hypothetical protein BCT61_14335 [Vibrio breoganii]
MNSEEFAGDYLAKKFSLNTSVIEPYEDVVKSGNDSRFNALKAMSTLDSYHTPDYVISDNLDDSLENLLFVDVSGPKGGLLTRTEIAIDKEISKVKSNLKVGQTRSIELTKQVKPLINGVRSKLIKINKKYALNRDFKKSISENNGVVYCMEKEPVAEHHSNSSEDLGAFQLSLTVLELLDFLSDGKCQLSDIENSGLNRPVKFKFNEKFKNISFVCFIGRGTLSNQSYIFINSDFLDKTANSFTKSINKMNCIDGNSFRQVRCAKSRLILDINAAVINDENPYVFPYGNINYKGDSFAGSKVPLEAVDLTDVHKQFDAGFRK